MSTVLTFFTHFHFLSTLSEFEICPARELAASSGRITSAGYPGIYSPNTNCTITIRQPLDTKITFTFNKMEIEREST